MVAITNKPRPALGSALERYVMEHTRRSNLSTLPFPHTDSAHSRQSKEADQICILRLMLHHQIRQNLACGDARTWEERLVLASFLSQDLSR